MLSDCLRLSRPGTQCTLRPCWLSREGEVWLDRVQLWGACWTLLLLRLCEVPEACVRRWGLCSEPAPSLIMLIALVTWTWEACFSNGPSCLSSDDVGGDFFKSPSGPPVLSSLDFLEFFWTDLESQCPARVCMQMKIQWEWEGHAPSLFLASKVRIVLISLSAKWPSRGCSWGPHALRILVHWGDHDLTSVFSNP